MKLFCSTFFSHRSNFRFDANSQLGACVPVVTISKLGTAKMQGAVCGSIDETSFFQFPNAHAVRHLISQWDKVQKELQFKGT